MSVINDIFGIKNDVIFIPCKLYVFKIQIHESSLNSCSCSLNISTGQILCSMSLSCILISDVSVLCR